MNDIATIETTETKETIQFPSHVKTPAPNSAVHEFAPELLSTSQDMNNVMQSAGNVHMFVRNHFVDMATGVYGIERLIAEILKANQAFFPIGQTASNTPEYIEETPMRTIAIAQAMFADEVIAKVREQFGADRYPDSVIASYLAHHMKKAKSKNQVRAIKLTKTEDANRTCCKPRSKYYLIDVSNIPAD